MGGYKILDDEFSSTLRELAYAGYGLFFISHSKEKEFTKDNGEKYTQIAPALADRPFNIVNKMVDIIAYLREVEVKKDDNVEKKRMLFFRGNDNFYAGSRFKYIVPYTELSYSNLVKAIYEAIDKEIAYKGGSATMESNPYNQRTFEDLMDEAKKLWGKAINENKVKDAAAILEEEFGKPTKFSEIVPDQFTQLERVLFKVKEIL